MAVQTLKLGHYNAYISRARRYLQPGELFHALAERGAVSVGAYAAYPLNYIQVLDIVSALAGFFKTSVVIAYADNGVYDSFALKRYRKAPGFLQGRMLRSYRYNDLVIAVC
jgi:hypothetical protein